MSHRLVNIPPAQWEKLRDLYKGHENRGWAYNLLQNFIDWRTKDSNVSVKIYALDGDWEHDGTFIVNDIYDGQIPMYYFNTLSDNQQRLITALNCIDQKKEYLLCGFSEHLLPAVKQHFADTGSLKEDFSHDGTFWYYKSRAAAENLTIDVPEGLTLAPLTVENAEQVNSVWPHRAPGSIEFVKRLICFNDSVGVFDSEGNLIAWCLTLPLGALGLLQVSESHKRKGLGNLVVRYMAKLISAKGRDVAAPVVFTNVASRSMFEKLSFKPIYKVYWSPKSGNNCPNN